MRMDTEEATTGQGPSIHLGAHGAAPVGSPWAVRGPATRSWREEALTRAAELRTLTVWLRNRPDDPGGRAADALVDAIDRHLDAAEATAQRASDGTRGSWLHRLTGAEMERVRSNLDAAEADLLRLAPPEYLAGQVPSLLAYARQHLDRTDARLERLEVVAREAARGQLSPPSHHAVVAAAHGASLEARAEVRRVRSFRNVLFVTSAVLALAALAVGVVGSVRPDVIPLCFAPDDMVVCPTRGEGPVAPGADVDVVMARTTTGWDYPVVELLGLIAAALAAAAGVRGIRGTSTPYGVPVALALLKLPTGALTAVLGLIAMRGEFVPGLSALDTPGQILAWAVAFGYAQQLFTRFVDRRAQTVLDDVGGHAR
jgi:hypothetical protein